MPFPDNVYNFIKTLIQYILPAIAALYSAVASIWNLPYGTQILGTIAGLETALGILIGVSTVQYNKEIEKDGGTLIVDQTPSGGDLYSFEFDNDQQGFAGKKAVTFQIKHAQEAPMVEVNTGRE